MSDATGASHALAATTITVAGVTTGLSYEVLLAGFAGALGAMSYLKSMGLLGRLWTLVTSTLVAGYAAPALGPYLANHLTTVPSQPLLLFSSLVIGLSAQAVIPGYLWYIGRKARNPEGRIE